MTTQKESTGTRNILEYVERRLRNLSITESQISDLQPYITSESNGVFGISVGNGLSEPSTGYKDYTFLPYTGSILGYIVTGDVVGDIEFDIWICSANNYPPVVSDSICSGNYPSLSSEMTKSDFTLADWTKNFDANVFVGFNLRSVSTITKGKLILITNKITV